MYVGLTADQSSLSSASDIHQTFRGNLQPTSDEATTSAALDTSFALKTRSRSDSELRPNSDQRVTSAELSQHSSEDNCWLAVKGKVCIGLCPRIDAAAVQAIITKVDMQVYDVTGWTAQHPGGRVIATYAGRDATDVFACFHAATSWGQLKQFYIGDLVVCFTHQTLACVWPHSHLCLRSNERMQQQVSACTM